MAEWSPEHAEQELYAWAEANKYRDEIIRAAFRAGVTKARISALTGVSRTTIDRILRDPPSRTGPADPAALTAFLSEFAKVWPRQDAASVALSRLRRPAMAETFTPEQIAEQLLGSPEFRALRLVTWLRIPRTEFITAAVQALTLPLYQEDINLLINAVSFAAQVQQREAREKAVGVGLVLAIGAALITGSRPN